MTLRTDFQALVAALLFTSIAPGCSQTTARIAEPAGGASASSSDSPAPAPDPAVSSRGAGNHAPASGGESKAKSTEKPAEPAKVYKPLTPPCESLFKQIEELEKVIPRVYRGLTRGVDDIHKDMLSCIDLCRRFLAECGGSSQAACDVKAILSRVELGRLSRFREELKKDKNLSEADRSKKYQDHMKESVTLAEEALAECPHDSPWRATAFQTLVDFYENLELWETLRATADQLLKEYPGYEDRQRVHLTVAQSFINERRYEEAIKYLIKVIKEHPNDPQDVLFNDRLFDALTGVGDLEGMEDLMHLIRAEYPTRVPEIPETNYLRAQYEQWVCISAFWIGFVRMALGDNDGAREWFKKQIGDASERAKKLTDQKKSPSGDVCAITADFRSSVLLYYLDNHFGKVPQAELDLDEHWATENQLSFKESRGKVVAIVFRMPGDRRAAKFLQEIDALVKKHEKNGLAGVVLGYLTGKPNPAEDDMKLQRMRDDLKRLGVSLPAGFDPDREAHKVFRELHGTVGTASFVLLNRKGEQAWFLADPRELDPEVARRVIERLLAEKP